jgi:hypothetical protein
MGFLDNSKSEQIKFLEDERKKMWERILAVEKNIIDLRDIQLKATSESAREASANSSKAAEFRNRAEKRLNEAESILDNISQIRQRSEKCLSEIHLQADETNKLRFKIEEFLDTLDSERQKFEAQNEKFSETLSVFQGFIEKNPNLKELINEFEESLKFASENIEKSNVSLTAINTKKREIDSIYREIFGYLGEDDSGVETKIEGLRDQLEKSYNTLKADLETSATKLEAINTNYESKYLDFEKSHSEKYASLISKIEELLPGALTTGLSSAYSKKKEEEENTQSINKRNFNTGVFLLGVISIIPVLASVRFIIEGVDLTTVLERLPRLVIAIIPIYIPALWYSISASKKVNLSKRLIEEYTHKEVVSKTFEGLSRQIEKLGESESTDELKLRLLTNILQVSSENPGKLISNYASSDHPMMEALEQSYKFQSALDKLDFIPGMKQIAAIINSSTNGNRGQKQKKIVEALNSNFIEEIND